MLKKIYDALTFVPDRYIDVTGDVYDVPLHQRFYHRPEFRTTAAAISILAAGMNLVNPSSMAETASLIAGAAFAYAFGRVVHEDVKDDIIQKFTRIAIIDLQPSKNMLTGPNDMLRAQEQYDHALKAAAGNGFSAIFASACFSTLALSMRSGLASSPEFPDPPIAAIYGIVGFISGYLYHNVSYEFGNAMRMKDVVDQKTVILEHKPHKQKEKSFDFEISVVPQQALQPAPIPVRP